MVFASGIFLYGFLPLFLLVYYLSPRGWRSLVIALASYVFYGWWRLDFVVLMLVSTVVDYGCGIAIGKSRERGVRGKRWVVLSLLMNLGLLGYFKYANFGVDTLNDLLGALGHDSVSWTRIVLPVGISFYTFQTISYTVDVYRGDAPPVRRFVDFMCYVAMFPQLVAGPIVRYNTIAEQLHDRSHTFGKFARGVLAFQIGFAKKVLIADVLGQVDAAVFSAPSASTANAWLGSTAFALQVYFDFSGYSDMAIGLGLMMGFKLPVNFDRPYVSGSFTEYWRGWHISLSSFLRDYLYIPLGGNRKGKIRTYVNLMLTMTLGGLWHGAAWNFVLWGAYNGFFLALERAAGRRSLYGFLPRPFQMAITFVLVTIGLAIFRSDGLLGAFDFLGSMFGVLEPAVELTSYHLRPVHVIAFVVSALLIWGTPTTQSMLAKPRVAFALAIQPLFVLALAQLHYQDFVPFLYYQF